MFKALMVDNSSGGISAAVVDLDEARLPAGNVIIDVEYSTVNYKDGLVITGGGGLVKQYPHVPGIDFSGSVRSSEDGRFKPGDKVILTGWRVGELRWGGLARKAAVNADWLVPLPPALSARQAMAVGTAGFTAMLAVMALEAHGITPESGEVLVTGAAGGVGSIATVLLARRGFKVAASTGRVETHDYLRHLGASTIIERAALSEPSKRPLESERWAGCIDSVGGHTLARVLAQLKYGGSAAAVGLAGGSTLEHTVLPFILRGVNLLGIDSVMCPMPQRLAAWKRIATDLPMDLLETLTETVALADVPQLASKILQGQVRGRVVVDVNR
jgi:acrylyl-CoA reductase (NADPH)